MLIDFGVAYRNTRPFKYCYQDNQTTRPDERDFLWWHWQPYSEFDLLGCPV